jgi:hypothetical protein
MLTLVYKYEELAENSIIFIRKLFCKKKRPSEVLERTLQYVTSPCSFVYVRFNASACLCEKLSKKGSPNFHKQYAFMYCTAENTINSLSKCV